MFDKLMETLYEKHRETKRWFGSSIKYIGRTSELLTQKSRWIGLNGPNLDHQFYIIFFSARRKDHVILIIIQPNWQIAHTVRPIQYGTISDILNIAELRGSKGVPSLYYTIQIYACQTCILLNNTFTCTLYASTSVYNWMCHFRVP